MVLKETILSINVTKCKEETMAYGAQKEFAATNKVMMWWSALISVVLLCLPLAAGAGVPNPTVTGPGTANVYSTPTLTTGTIVSSGHPYKSRIIVRRPTSRARFNGTVLVEWVNVTSGYNN